MSGLREASVTERVPKFLDSLESAELALIGEIPDERERLRYRIADGKTLARFRNADHWTMGRRASALDGDRYWPP